MFSSNTMLCWLGLYTCKLLSRLPSELIPGLSVLILWCVFTCLFLVPFGCKVLSEFLLFFFSGTFIHGVISTLMIKRPEISKICQSGHYSCFIQDGFDVWRCPVFFKRQNHLCLKRNYVHINTFRSFLSGHSSCFPVRSNTGSDSWGDSKAWR